MSIKYVSLSVKLHNLNITSEFELENIAIKIKNLIKNNLNLGTRFQDDVEVEIEDVSGSID